MYLDKGTVLQIFVTELMQQNVKVIDDHYQMGLGGLLYVWIGSCG